MFSRNLFSLGVLAYVALSSVAALDNEITRGLKKDKQGKKSKAPKVNKKKEKNIPVTVVDVDDPVSTPAPVPVVSPPAPVPVVSTPAPVPVVSTPAPVPVSVGVGPYAFASRFIDGESSVSYSGQTARLLLIDLQKKAVGDVDACIYPGEVESQILMYYDCPGTICETAGTGVSVDAPLTVTQATVGDVSSSKNLVGKTAGNDPIGQHKDWTTEFRGWNDWGNVTTRSPENLIRHWAKAVDDLSQKNLPPGTKYFVSPEGQDYQQLIQKFVLGAVAFSQGVDDYLDNDTDGKGLNSDNTESNKGKAYSALEHGWDEAYGYFGAAADYLEYTDDEIAGKGGRDGYSNGYHDTDGNGEIDLKSEKNFGHSLNAAKRDRGSVSTDFTSEVYNAFHAGRSLITAAGGALTDVQMAELVGFRDAAVKGWEKAIAATVIHYINDCIADINVSEIDFYNYAKHWSEMKGFALSFQFNRLSVLSDQEFARVHELFRDAPDLARGPRKLDWENELLEARDILESAYDFDPVDVINW